MKRNAKSRSGFSLIEISMTIAVTAFALIGIIGVLPIAMQQTRNCVDETRAAQMARLVFATVRSEPFTAARCFGPEGGATLDFSTFDATSLEGAENQTVLLFASYDVRNQAMEIVRADTAPANAEYRLELTFEPARLPPPPSASPAPATSATPAPRGTLLRLRVFTTQIKGPAVFEAAQFVSRLRHGSS